jgi:bifunctional non-homologous end joining protein LigD
VFVPIERTLDFDAVRQVCEMVGRHLLRQHPRDITMEWAVVKRTGKIFIDYNMNVRGKTLNSAYSPRGAPGAPVSMPLTWKQIKKGVKISDFTIENVPALIKKSGNSWKDFFDSQQTLNLKG